MYLLTWSTAGTTCPALCVALRATRRQNKTKRRRRKKKIIIRKACLDERIWQDVWQVTVMRCQKRVGGGSEGLKFCHWHQRGSVSVTMATWQSTTTTVWSNKTGWVIGAGLFIYFFSSAPLHFIRESEIVCVYERKLGVKNKTKKTTHSCSYWQFCRCLDPHLKDKKKTCFPARCRLERIRASGQSGIVIKLTDKVKDNRLHPILECLHSRLVGWLELVHGRVGRWMRGCGGGGGRGWWWAEGDKLTTWNVTPWVSPLVPRS